MRSSVYILKSLKNGSYYIGSTDNLTNRLDQHNKGKSKYTKNILPVKLLFYQNYSTLKKARQIEYRLKRLKRRDIIEHIIKEGKIDMGL